jgi:hypothetical protein
MSTTKKGKAKQTEDRGGNVLERASKARTQKSAAAQKQAHLTTPEKSSDDEEGHQGGRGAEAAESLTHPAMSGDLRNRDAEPVGPAEHEGQSGTSGAQDGRHKNSSEQTNDETGSAHQVPHQPRTPSGQSSARDGNKEGAQRSSRAAGGGNILITQMFSPAKQDPKVNSHQPIAVTETEHEPEYVSMSASEFKEFAAWKKSQSKGAETTFKEREVSATTFMSSKRHTFSPEREVVVIKDSSSSSSPERQSPPRQASFSNEQQRDNTVLDPEPVIQSPERNLSGKVSLKPKPKPPQGSPKKGTPSRKRSVQEVKCPRCGSTDSQHDWVQCREPKGDFPRSADENAFLKQMTILRRMSSNAKASQRKEMAESSSEEGEDLGGEEEDEEDALEDGEDADEEEEEDESADPSHSSSSDPTYRPSSVESSVTRPEKMSKQDARLNRMETAIAQLTALMMAREQPTSQVSKEQLERPQKSASGGSTFPTNETKASDHRAGSIEGRSVLNHLVGMEGCPELQREDLLKFAKFEEFEKKYKEYLDKAADRRRTSHNMAYGFRKFSFELRQYIRTLFGKTHTLRESYRSVLPSFDLSEDEFLAMPNAVFQKLYREVCTHHSCLPSQVLQSLEATQFKRGDASTLPALVVQASAAFRERLRELPQQTIRLCTAKQLKESFIRMLLGPDERNLADFPIASTWEEVISALLELDGTSEANTLVHKIRQVGKSDKPLKEEEVQKEERKEGGGAVRSRPKQPQQITSSEENDELWTPQLEKLVAEFKPTQQQLQGCTSNHQKVLRILQIRDTRKREVELKEMRAANTGGAAVSPASASSKLVSKPQPQSRSQLGEEPTCFYCKEKGHYKRDCPKRGKGGESSEGEDT